METSMAQSSIHNRETPRGEAAVTAAVLATYAELYTDTMKIRELARYLGCNPGAIHRAVAVLTKQQLLTSLPDGSYTFGQKLRDLAIVANSSNPVGKTISRHLEELRDKTGETVSITEFHSGTKIIPYQAESHSQLRMVLPVGKPLPITGSVTDRLFLAVSGPDTFLPDDRTRLMSQHEAEIPLLKQQRWAVSEGTIIEGGIAIGVILQCADQLRVLSIIGPTQRMETRGVDWYVNLAIEQGSRLEMELGGRQPRQVPSGSLVTSAPT